MWAPIPKDVLSIEIPPVPFGIQVEALVIIAFLVVAFIYFKIKEWRKK